MTKNTITHKGTKRATSVQLSEDVHFYYSRPVNSKKGGAFISILGRNPATGKSEKVRLTGREVSALRKVLSKA